jgi:hypothetical protein
VKRKVIVPIDLGGSLHHCVLRPALRGQPSGDLVEAMMHRYREDNGRIDEVAYFHGGIPTDGQLTPALGLPIRLGCSPKDLTRAAANRLLSAGLKTVELEFLGFVGPVLRRLRRGYHPSTAEEMVTDLKSKGCRVGITLSPGLPGTRFSDCIQDAHRVVSLGADFVRLCPVLVWKGSTLADWLRQGSYKVLEVDQAVSVLREMISIFDQAEIDVIRVGWQPSQDMGARVVGGPMHPNLRALIEYRRFFDRMSGALAGSGGRDVRLLVNPKDVSWARGVCGENLRHLRAKLRIPSLEIKASENVPRGQVRCSPVEDCAVFEISDRGGA